MKTKRCSLNLIHENDFHEVKQLYLNDRVRYYLGGIINDEKSLRNRFSTMLDDSKNNDSKYWIVRLLEKNEFIGLISFDKHHDGINIEISYQFLPKFWGKGLAEETLRTMIEYAFGELGIKKLVAETQTANFKSCKLLEKLGMTIEERLIRFDAEQFIYSIQKH